MVTEPNWAGYFILRQDNSAWLDSDWIGPDIVGAKIAVFAESPERKFEVSADFQEINAVPLSIVLSELVLALDKDTVDLAWVSAPVAGSALSYLSQFNELVIYKVSASGDVAPYSAPQPVEGDVGDNDFPAHAGDRSIDGKEGTDTVQFDGGREAHTVSVGTNGIVTVVKPGGGVDGLTSIERLEFSDGSLVFDLDSENASFAYRIYAAAYGRTPDEDGLRFWTDVLDQRGDGPPEVDDKEFVASFFLTADEFIDVYGENPTNEEYINKLYQNVLHREADQGGYDFWLGKIEEGEGRDDMLIYFTDSDENVANTAPDFDDGIWVL